MESRKLAALLSILISEILLVLLLSPSSSPLSLSSIEHNHANSIPNSIPNSFTTLFPFLSLHEIATSLSLLPFSRKRKRTHSPDPPDPDADAHPSPAPIPTRDLDSFVGFFKMTSSTFEWLTGLLEPLLDCRDPVGSPLSLSPELRLGIGLFRLATGSDYADVSRRFGVPVFASRFCTKQLCRVLCTNFRFWVGYPSPNELEVVSRDFESFSGLPNCCGAIDCVRFKHQGDGSSSNDSIAVQVVCDSSYRILSIVAGFRGNKGKSRVLKLSSLCGDIEGRKLLNSNPLDVRGVNVNQYIVGGKGYPLLPWLMVPFESSVPGSLEYYFNSAHSSSLSLVTRTISSLKNWGVLSSPLEEDFKMAVACIGACSILHNALLMREDYSALSDGSEDLPLDHLRNEEFVESGLWVNSDIESALGMRDALAGLVKEGHDSSNSLNADSS